MKRKEYKTINNIEHKECNNCKKWTIITNFYKDSSCWDNLTNKCKSCCRKLHKIYFKEYYLKNKDTLNIKIKHSYFLNKEKRNTRAKLYKREQRKTNLNYKIKDVLRARVQSAIKKNSKFEKTLQMLGCSISYLKEYLKSQFQEGMSWDNHGFGRDKWNIDHIMPCVSFDLSKLEEQRKCFHYSNMQPLWQPDNFKKGAKIV